MVSCWLIEPPKWFDKVPISMSESSVVHLVLHLKFNHQEIYWNSQQEKNESKEKKEEGFLIFNETLDKTVV